MAPNLTARIEGLGSFIYYLTRSEITSTVQIIVQKCIAVTYTQNEEK